MKLAIVGAAVLALGAVLGVDGLILSGALWTVLGLLMRAVVPRKEATAAGVRPVPPTDRASFVRGTLILLAVGLPSLAIGVFEIGFPEADRDWRWVPIAVGALDTGIALLSSLMYMTGSGLEAAADAIGVPDQPATITIRAMRETGTYVNERPRIEFELLVEPDESPPYEVTKRATVPHTALASLKVGGGFRALVLPEKPTTMEIEWDAPVAGGKGDEPEERLERLERLHREGAITAAERDRQRSRILDSL